MSKKREPATPDPRDYGPRCLVCGHYHGGQGACITSHAFVAERDCPTCVKESRREGRARGQAVSWQVVAQGHVITKIGRTCFGLREAAEIAADLRTRGYADAHVKKYTSHEDSKLGRNEP